MAKRPLIPQSRTNPVGQTRRIRKARRVTNKRLKEIEAKTLSWFESISFQVQNEFMVNRFYDYNISLEELRLFIEELTGELQNVGQVTLAAQVRAAYVDGTNKTVENLSRLIDDYTREITQVLSSDPWLRRAALVIARTFEEMKGFSADTAADLGRVLFEGIQDGKNPRVVARSIRERFGVARRRAEKIARTEMTMALRRGRWDETRDAQQSLGLNIALIHYSALIPGRTRRTHAARHGKVVTVEEQADWYSQDGNAINCLCSQTEITLDEDGQPIFGESLLQKLNKQRRAFMASFRS